MPISRTRAGDLDRRITIEANGTAQDTAGQPIDGWAPITTPLWSKRLVQSGIGTIRSSADVSIVKASFRVRYRADIASGMRVIDGTDTYMIQSVLPVGRNEFMDLVTERAE